MFSNCIFSCLQAFAWWPELLAEHAEKFLSLYSVDMDSALEAQPPDSWDSFPLFQLLNNALRNDSKVLRFLLTLCVRFFNVPISYTHVSEQRNFQNKSDSACHR